MSDEEVEANRRRWDEMVAVNLTSDLYNLDAFKRGERPGLHPFEWAWIGDVVGRRILHLQCHFGLDSLALARAGARVTGLDFSGNAIRAARELAAELGLEASFVEGEVYDAPILITGSFDLVYVTWGTICWLPDIAGWARIVAGFLKAGGCLFFADAHPFALTLDDEDPTAPPLKLRYPYFHKPAPLVFDEAAPYGDKTGRLENARNYEWTHSVLEVADVLIRAGLTIERLEEHEFCAWGLFPFMTRDEDGLWRLPVDHPRIPLSYSILARRPEI